MQEQHDAPKEKEPFEVKKQRIATAFIKDRKRISAEIKLLVQKLRHINELSGAQVEILSTRQRLLEDMHTLIENVRSLENKMRAKKAKHYEEMTKGNYLYKDREKAAMVDGKVTDIKELLTIFQDQVDYYQDSIKTLDGAHYGVKYRIEIEKSTGI